jgi:hypothetical protein
VITLENIFALFCIIICSFLAIYFVAKMAEFRPAIVKLSEKGKSIREISALLNVPYTTVQNALKR